MACENLDNCALLDELSSSTSIGSSMLMSTICENNKFACESYRSSNATGDEQCPINKMDVMELIIDQCNGISITA